MLKGPAYETNAAASNTSPTSFPSWIFRKGIRQETQSEIAHFKLLDLFIPSLVLPREAIDEPISQSCFLGSFLSLCNCIVLVFCCFHQAPFQILDPVVQLLHLCSDAYEQIQSHNPESTRRRHQRAFCWRPPISYSLLPELLSLVPPLDRF